MDLKFLDRLLEKGIKVSLPIFRWRNKRMDESQQALFSGFKKSAPDPKEGPKNAILGAISDIMLISYPIILKPGVQFKVLKPEVYSAFGTISRIFYEIGRDCVITSAHDGDMHKGYSQYLNGSRDPDIVSRHYLDLAFDVRSKHLIDAFQKQIVWKMLVDGLGKGYRVLFEKEGTDSEHFHVAAGY